MVQWERFLIFGERELRLRIFWLRNVDWGKATKCLGFCCVSFVYSICSQLTIRQLTTRLGTAEAKAKFSYNFSTFICKMECLTAVLKRLLWPLLQIMQSGNLSFVLAALKRLNCHTYNTAQASFHGCQDLYFFLLGQEMFFLFLFVVSVLNSWNAFFLSANFFY